MAGEAVKFFKAQCSETVVPTTFGIIDHVPRLVDMEQNSDLIRQPTKYEVKQAIFGLNGESAGGPDGSRGTSTIPAGTLLVMTYLIWLELF